MSSAVSSLLSSLLGSSSSSGSSATSSSSSSSSSTASTSSSQTAQNTPAYELSLSQAAQNQNLISALQSLQTLGQEFSGNALGLATSDLNNSVTSSDQNVASISTSTNNNYSLNVTQLAQEQTLTSSIYSSSSATVGTAGTLTLQLGEWQGSTFTAAGPAATSVAVTNPTVSGIATAINSAKAGVTASIVTVSTGVELQLTGTSTGLINGFSIGANGGLGALEYDKTAQSLSLTQSADDASYTVNGSLYTAPDNTSVPVANGVNVDLKRTGSVTVTQSEPPTQMLQNIQTLVGYVNNMIQGLSQVQSALGPNNSGVVEDMVSQLTQVGFQNLNGNSSISTLADIGFDVQPDGTVQFNQTTFEQAYSQDPNATSFVAQQAALTYSNAVSNYTGGNGQVQQQVNELDQLQTALVYGAQASAQAAKGSPSSTYSPYGQTSNPWAGTTF